MLPDYNTLAAAYSATYDSLAAIDTDGLYTCLAPDCCTGIDNWEWTKFYKVRYLLDQYLLTGELPVIEDVCCQWTCGSITGATPTAFTSPTFTDLTVSDDLVVDGAFTRGGISQPVIRTGTGTLSGGTLAVAGAWVTTATIIQLTYTGTVLTADVPLTYTISNGVSFTVTGTGTNTFSWVAFVPQA